MTLWDFTADSTSVIKTLRDADPPREQSFNELSLRMVDTIIYLYEAGQYASAVKFEQIGDIGGVAPTDLQDAYDRILAIIPTSGGGSGSIIYIEVTKTELDTLITAEELVKGATYKITGVHPTLYDDGTTSGTTIYLKAIENNQLETNGMGEFFNPTYEEIGGWGIFNQYVQVSIDNIVGTFDENESVTSDNSATGILFGKAQGGFIIPLTGDWSTAVSITGDTTSATADIAILEMPSNHAIDDLVFWGGYQWKNVTGDLGGVTDDLSLSADWEKQPYITGDYTKVFDEIKYDYTNDLIEYRADNIGNYCAFTKIDYDTFGVGGISYFQWGLPLCTYGNKVNNAYCINVNFRGSINFNNTYAQDSQNFNNTYAQGSLNYSNTYAHGSQNFNNTYAQGSSNYSNTYIGLYFQNNELKEGVIITNTVFEKTDGTPTFPHYVQNIIFEQGVNIDSIDISTANTIYESFSKTVYARPDGTVKIRYYSDLDILTIVPFDN